MNYVIKPKNNNQLLQEPCGKWALDYRVSRALAVFGLVLTLSACITTNPTKTPASYVAPARAVEATKLRRVAVLPFAQLRDEDVTSDVELSLAEAKVTESPFYTVVERARLDLSLRELKLSSSKAIDPKTAVRIGKFVGAEGVYIGAVTKNEIVSQQFTEKRSGCKNYITKKDKKGNPYEECEKFTEWTVQCTKKTANYSFIPKLLDVETAVIRYSREIAGTAGFSACTDSAAGMKEDKELLSEAKRGAIFEFKADVVPHLEHTSIALLESGTGITDEKEKVLFKRGVMFAKADRLDRACQIWGDVSVSSSPDFLYSKGVCAELLENNLTLANSLYQAADRLTTEPVDAIGEALRRIKKKILEANKLAAQVKGY